MYSPYEDHGLSAPGPIEAPQPLQFSLKTIFILTAIVAALSAGASAGGPVGVLVAAFVVGILSCIAAYAFGRMRLQVCLGLLAGQALFALFLVLPWSVILVAAFVIGFLWCVTACALGQMRLRVCLGLLAGPSLFAWLLLAPSDRGGKPLRSQCLNNIHQLGLALLNYEQSRARFPPAFTVDASSQRLHSWRTLILPYVEEMARYNQIKLNEPWNSAHNLPLTQAHFEWLHCPGDKSAGDFDTSYVAIVGPGTIWDPTRVHYASSVKDGLSNTILLVEMHNSGIKWAEPRDLDLSNLPLGITKQNLPTWLSAHSGGFNVVFADGAVRFISSTIPWDVFMAMLTTNGGEKVNRDEW